MTRRKELSRATCLYYYSFERDVYCLVAQVFIIQIIVDLIIKLAYHNNAIISLWETLIETIKELTLSLEDSEAVIRVFPLLRELV